MLPDPLTVTEKLDLCEGGADVDWTDVFPLVGIWLKL